jgi:TPP-dependent pyruvate/acetoin dehydrogenase alpha subunit
VDGLDPLAVYAATGKLLKRARDGKGPGFLLARCIRADGHFLNDPLVRMAHSPIGEGGETFKKVLSSAVKSGGGGLGARTGSVVNMMGLLRKVRKEGRDSGADPLVKIRKKLKAQQTQVEAIEKQVAGEVARAVQQVVGDAEQPAGSPEESP